MFDWLKKEETNTSRQYNLDLLKALAIVCMIICHCVTMICAHLDGYENDFLYWFSDVVLGDYIAVAHAFMFAMGVGFVYTEKNKAVDYVKRGIKILILGYVLNFFRYGIFTIIYGLISGEFNSRTLESFFGSDILQFAGLAMILTGVFKKLRLSTIYVLLISFVMSVAGSCLVLMDTGNYIVNNLLGQFVTTTFETSAFALFNWYIFVASGMLFGEIIRRINEPDGFYKRLFILSGILSIIYITLTFIFGTFFLTRHNYYYGVSMLEATGLLSTDLFLLSMFHFLQKKAGPDKFKVFIEMSKNITPIYFVHWCIIGSFDCILCFALEMTFPYYVVYPFGIVLIIVSFYVARVWNILIMKRKLRATQTT